MYVHLTLRKSVAKRHFSALVLFHDLLGISLGHEVLIPHRDLSVVLEQRIGRIIPFKSRPEVAAVLPGPPLLQLFRLL